MKVSMISGLIAILIASGIGYVLYVVLPLYQAIQHSKMLMSHAAPYEQHPAETTTTVLIAGDSTAVGTGATLPSESIAGRIGADYPNADIANMGLNGLKLAGLELKLQALPETAHYSLMVLQIGANDVTGFTSVNDVKHQLQNVLDLARAHANHVIVLTAGDVGTAPIFKFPLSLLFHHRTQLVRDIFLQETSVYATSTPDVTYIDLYTSVPPKVFNADINRFYGVDHFHPSGDGYEKWYEQVRPAVQKALSSGA